MNSAQKEPAVENWPIAQVVPYARNARVVPESAIIKVASSIREFGFKNPMLIKRDGTIIAGHTRLMAAMRLGLDTVPVIVCDDLSDAQAKALRLADNRTAQETTWEYELLNLELEELAALDIDLRVTGFDSDELAGLDFGGGQSGADPDEVPEPPAEPRTKPGDLWLLGEHRVLCGDATKSEDVRRLMDGKKAECVFTSPPYAVGIDYGAYEDTLPNLREMLDVLPALWVSVLVPGGFAVVNFGDIISGAVPDSDGPCEYPMAVEYWPRFRSAGFVLWSRRAWCKPTPRVHSPWCIQSNRAASDWEHVWTWKAPGDPIVRRVDGSDSSVNGWVDTTRDTGVDVGKETHGAGMATSLARRMVNTHTRNGGAVLEPFCGTGTTLIAAEQTGRVCYGMELDPRYCDVIVKRWENFTGNKAVVEHGSQAS